MILKFGNYCLRPWIIADVHAVTRYANNRKIWLNLRDGFPNPYAEKDAREFIERAMKLELPTLFAIANSKEAIGSIGLMLKTDIHRHTAELGYWLGEPFWGQGITTEAVKTISAFAFEKFNLVRIHAEPFVTNQPSIRVLEKAGYKYEGRTEVSAFKDGKLLDQVIYARTRKVKNEELQ